jgi:hypothetical protein
MNENKPFEDGDRIEVILFKKSNAEKYPYHGIKITYIDPMEPVADDDWEVLHDTA